MDKKRDAGKEETRQKILQLLFGTPHQAPDIELCKERKKQQEMGAEMEEIITEIETKIKGDLAAYAAKNSGKIICAQDKINRAAKQTTGAEIKLSKKGKRSASLTSMDFLTQAGAVIEEPLSVYETAILEAVYSIIEDGNKAFSTAQIYKKMRGGVDVNPNAEAVNEIDRAIMKLGALYVNIENNASAAAQMDGLKKIREPLLKVTSLQFTLNGAETWGYILNGYEMSGKTVYEPILLAIAKTLKHIETIPESVLNVKQLTGAGKLKKVQMTRERVTLRKYMQDFIITLIRANGNITNKQPYADILERCDIDTGHRQRVKRYKEFIGTLLNHFVREGLITGWQEYGDGRGVEIYAEKTTVNNLFKERE